MRRLAEAFNTTARQSVGFIEIDFGVGDAFFDSNKHASILADHVCGFLVLVGCFFQARRTRCH